MDLLQAHGRVFTELKELELEREGPVHLIEHSFTPDELQELGASLTTALTGNDLDSSFWNARYLPLLVFATEVGYDFGEQQHAYWPHLTARLGADFVNTPRCDELARRFLSRSSVVPPRIPWVLHFRRIAFPITHAVLPRWLHEPLLDTLLSLRGRVTTGGGYFTELLEIARRHVKLDLLLHPDREPLAREVVEGILDIVEPKLLRRETLERFRRDVMATPSTRALLRKAKARQVLLRPAPPRPTGPGPGPAPRPPTPPALRVPLTLSVGGALELGLAAVVGPGFVTDGLGQVRAKPFAERRPMSLAALLRHGVPLTQLPEPGDGEVTPVFVSENLPLVEPQLRLHLGSLRANVRPPLLFTTRQGPAGVAVQAFDDTFSPTPDWWVLTGDESPDGDGLLSVGRCLGLTCVGVDASLDDGAEWLKAQGFQEGRTPSLRLVGAAAVDGPAGRTFATTDPLMVELEDGPARLDGEELVDGVYQVDPGTHRVEHAAGGRVLEFKLDRATQPRSRAPVACELLGQERTVEGLRERRMAVRITGHRRLAGLRLQLAVVVDGVIEAQGTTRPLPPLPWVVGAEDPVWEALASRAPTSRPFALVASIGGLASIRWWLEPAVREVSWLDATPALAPSALSEATVLGYRRFNADAPMIATELPGSIHLAEPVFEAREAAPGAGLVVAPDRMSLHAEVRARPVRFIRAWASIEPILAAHRRWSTARSQHLLAEAARGRVVRDLEGWIVRSLCGEAWSEAEARLPKQQSLGEVVANQLFTDGITEVAPAERGWSQARTERFLKTLGAAVGARATWLESLAADPEAPCDGLAALLDQAFRAVDCPDEDPACEDEATRRSLNRAFAAWRARCRLEPLPQRLLPQGSRAELCELQFGEPEDREIASAVAAWLRRASLVAPWPEEQVEALLAVWLWPARAQLTEPLFAQALADQHGARAVRYAALRRRAERP